MAHGGRAADGGVAATRMGAGDEVPRRIPLRASRGEIDGIDKTERQAGGGGQADEAGEASGGEEAGGGGQADKAGEASGGGQADKASEARTRRARRAAAERRAKRAAVERRVAAEKRTRMPLRPARSPPLLPPGPPPHPHPLQGPLDALR
uniref:Uncharacterized protein n=1 Tax=Oryza sativa subsp. japonica TaxID=39947 RepID=Q67VS4_ORYSJ|nr:hypothetical protein [Oryza sativa Japonica Group]